MTGEQITTVEGCPRFPAGTVVRDSAKDVFVSQGGDLWLVVGSDESVSSAAFALPALVLYRPDRPTESREELAVLAICDSDAWDGEVGNYVARWLRDGDYPLSTGDKVPRMVDPDRPVGPDPSVEMVLAEMRAVLNGVSDHMDAWAHGEMWKALEYVRVLAPLAARPSGVSAEQVEAGQRLASEVRSVLAEARAHHQNVSPLRLDAALVAYDAALGVPTDERNET